MIRPNPSSTTVQIALLGELASTPACEQIHAVLAWTDRDERHLPPARAAEALAIWLAQ